MYIRSVHQSHVQCLHRAAAGTVKDPDQMGGVVNQPLVSTRKTVGLLLFTNGDGLITLRKHGMVPCLPLRRKIFSLLREWDHCNQLDFGMKLFQLKNSFCSPNIGTHCHAGEKTATAVIDFFGNQPFELVFNV